MESRPASRIPKKAVWHVHINRVINPRVAERRRVDIWLDEIGEEIERPRIQKGKSKPEDDRTEMVVPTKIEFVINETPPLNIEALADTGSEMEALAGRGLFPPHLLEDAQKPVALIGAGKSRIHGGSQGVTVHITVPVCREDGTLVRYKCSRVFLYVADIGKKMILGFPFFLRYNLCVVPGMPTFMQVPRFVKSKKGLPRKIRCTREAPPPTPSHTSPNTQSHNRVQLLKNTVANVKMSRHTSKFSTSQEKHTNRSSHEKETKISTNKEYCWQLTCTNSPCSHSPWSDPFDREIPHLCAHCATRSAGSTKELVYAKSPSALPRIEGIHSKKVCTSPFSPAIQKCGPMIHHTVYEKFIDMVPQESKNRRRKGVRKLTVALQGEGSMVHTPPSSPRPPSPMGHQESIHRQWPQIQQVPLAVGENQNKVNSENSSLPSCHADVVSFPSYHSHVVCVASCNEHVLKVQRLTEQAIIPTSAHEDDAGYELYASAPVSIPPWSKALIPTDLAIQGPPGTYARIADRSRLALKHSLHVLGGVVDRSYRGNVKVILYHGSSMPYEVQHGDKISQFILERFSKPPIVLVDELPSSDRGISGFGSSDNSVQDTTKAGSNHITPEPSGKSAHTPLHTNVRHTTLFE